MAETCHLRLSAARDRRPGAVAGSEGMAPTAGHSLGAEFRLAAVCDYCNTR